jgi:uncharacterized membrane protein
MAEDRGNGARADVSGNGASTSRAPTDGGSPRPLGEVVASTVNGFRTLYRQHVELARIEATEAAGVRAQGAGMMAAAAGLALYAVGFLAAAAAAILALVLPTWAAILIVAMVLASVAGGLVAVGRRTIRTAPPPVERTRQNLKEDVRWAKTQLAR